MPELKKSQFPTIYVIFGITGDLAKRKLLPALLALHSNNVLPTKFAVLGFSRRKWKDDEFRKEVKKHLRQEGHKNNLDSFLDRFHFQQGYYDKPESYKHLLEHIHSIDDNWKVCTNKLLHLSVPPETYPEIFKYLEKSGFASMCGPEEGWTRVLVEKPFGKDIKTAQKLEIKLSKVFKEEQIFRVDHYLGKETIQNILTFRFSNAMFEPIWNYRHIRRVEIKALEKIDVGTRGLFYDDIGALRDMGQSHLLQMLALTAMENPKVPDGEHIRREREKVLDKLRIISQASLKKNVARGQYDGYLKTLGVKKHSKRETYFLLKAFIHSPRWKNVPFYLESGKALDKKNTEVTVYFKEPHPCFCPPSHKEHQHRNTLTFTVDPVEGISVRFWAKKPGLGQEIEPKNLSFKYHNRQASRLGSYERLLFDAIEGNRMLFPSTEEVMASWRFITPIITHWNRLKLHVYEKGSKGPDIRL